MNPIRGWVEETPLVDTHEHLIEEEQRLEGKLDGIFPCDDWTYLFWHYFADDLASAGMPEEEKKRLFDPATSTDKKAALLLPWWERAKLTGYGQAVRLTLQGLYGEDDLTAESAPRIAEKYREWIRPGFYREILKDKCGLDHCQVNSLQTLFMESSQPDLLRQDLSILSLSTSLDRDFVEGEGARCLDDWLGVIERKFRKFGPKAVAVKSQCAYERGLDFGEPDQAAAERVFVRWVQGESLSPEDRKPLEDFLFDACVRKATEVGLPVKLHTGTMAGYGYMPLERVRRNASDLCSLLQRHREARFVLMHIGFPYQHEMIALAKHYANVYIDMCWAWILSPRACVSFLKEYMLAAPASKLFTFGGDYITVETVYGHSRIARMGIAQAVSEMVQEGWLRLEEAKPLIERIMNGNAREAFPNPASS
ncbi:MAG: amidohydrolase family protein [Armatimonadetes bacterium]|nr:amidohydrolase family protein [Armatimonadota bacterium]